jgi:hypothetical protein
MAGMLDRITGALRRAVGRITGGKRAEAKGRPVQPAGQPKGGAKVVYLNRAAAAVLHVRPRDPSG